MRANKKWVVGVFAHNEEARIARSIKALIGAQAGVPTDIYVLANGCTDRTENIAQEFSSAHPEVHVVSLPCGDKASTWNYFVHEMRPDGETFFFTDGDCWIDHAALGILDRALDVNPQAHAASGAPGVGVTRRQQVEELIREHGLMGNLYALRGSFVERLRATGTRLPIGLIGDDSLVGSLVKWNLCTNPWCDAFVIPDPTALFYFDAPPLRSYCGRLLRYSMRRYQIQLLGQALRTQGLRGLPRRIEELYYSLDACRASWRGVNTVFDWMALRQMRRSRALHPRGGDARR